MPISPSTVSATSDLWPVIGTVMGAAVATAFQYLRERRAPRGAEPVIAASVFSDRSLMLRLADEVEDNTRAQKDVVDAIEINTKVGRVIAGLLERLADHLKAESQDLHDEAVRRAERLEQRGANDKGSMP